MPSAQVTIYTKHGCQACRATQRLLKKNGIDYREISVSDDPQSRKELIDKGIREMPYVKVESSCYNDSWTGFRPSKIEELLEVL